MITKEFKHEVTVTVLFTIAAILAVAHLYFWAYREYLSTSVTDCKPKGELAGRMVYHCESATGRHDSRPGSVAVLMVAK